jgi:L-ribulose-5-phosphate 4-epimerase
MNILELKKKLAQAVRTLAGGNILTLTVGHVSCRIPDNDNILILGHSHKAYKTLDTITEADIIIMDLEGNVVEGNYEPPGERYIHTEIYKARPDVNSIVHGHPEMSTIFSIGGKKIIPVYYRAAQFRPEVPVMDFAGQIDTKELGTAVAKAIGNASALLLRGHGNIVVGESIEEAGVNAFALETNARMQFYASLIGSPIPLKDDEIKKHKPTSVWSYYVKKYDSMFEEYCR